MNSLAFYYARNSYDVRWNVVGETRSYCVNELSSFTYWNSFEDTPCAAPSCKHAFRHIETGYGDMTVVFMGPDVSVSV